jgi:hypothetical protein
MEDKVVNVNGFRLVCRQHNIAGIDMQPIVEIEKRDDDEWPAGDVHVYKDQLFFNPPRRENHIGYPGSEIPLTVLVTAFQLYHQLKLQNA